MAQWRISRRRAFATAAVSGAVAAAAVAAVAAQRGVVAPASGAEAWAMTAVAPGGGRRLEPRLSRPEADRHRPYVAPRASGPSTPPSLPLEALAALEQKGDRHAIASVFLLAGDIRQAEEQLAEVPQSPDTDGDRAAIALLRQDPERALVFLDPVLRARPDHAPAMWNRALALEARGLDLGAAVAFEAVAARGEQGWSPEAAERARRLREGFSARRRAWEGAEEARRRLISRDGAMPLALAGEHPDLARDGVHEALRSAVTVGEVRALAGIAAALDRRWGGDALRRAVARAEARVRRSGPSPGARYRELLLGARVLPRHEQDNLLERLRRGNEPDILFGALAHTRQGYVRGAEMATLAGRLGDPYLALVAEDYRAIGEAQVERLPADAERRLVNAVAACDRARHGRLCNRLRLTLSWLLSGQHRLREGQKLAEEVRRNARAAGDIEHETTALERLGHSAFAGKSTAVVRAYTEEALLRRPEDCAVRSAAAESLASMALREQDIDEARRQIALATGCPSRGLSRIAVLATLARFGGTADEAARLSEALRFLSHGPLPPPPAVAAQAMAFEGRAELERDAAAGRIRLRQAVEMARDLHEDDDGTTTARWLGLTALAFEASRRGAHGEAFGAILELERVRDPGGCVLAMAADLERTTAVARGPRGVLAGSYDGRARTPYEPESLVPAALRAALRGCAEVAVVAPPPLFGLARLLPANLAWAYASAASPVARLGNHAPGDRGSKRLVVSDVVPPDHLDLPPVGRWRAAPRAGESLVWLRGAEATPETVLAAMSGVHRIDLHVHGLIDPAIADASFLVLATGAGGTFALSHDQVRRLSLREGPVVLLAACHAADRSRAHHNSWGLPRAFLHAGARAVIAARSAVPDEEAGAFFEAVGDRLASGVEPAVAVRDERTAWRSRSHASVWVEDVLVFR